MSEHDYEAILDVMDFEVVEQANIELPLSTPAVLEFESDTSLDVSAFESEIDEHHYAMFSTLKETNDDGGFYFKTRLLTDHSKEVIIKADANTVRIFHKGDRIDVYEISRIIHAIENAFEAELNFDVENQPGGGDGA